MTLALTGHSAGPGIAAGLFVLSAVATGLAARLLAPVHRHVWESAREVPLPARAIRARPPGSPAAVLVRSELATLLRDASTPAQLGSLAAVFLLYLLNLRLLPAAEPAARDLVAGLQTGLALFLVSALSLRFGYPAVSGDGRGALVIRSLPLSPLTHLLVRWGVRAVPSAAVALVLTGSSLAVLKPGSSVVIPSMTVALAGGLSIPALNVGLGGLFARYEAPNPIAVALGSGGLFALTVSSALSSAAAVAVSAGLRGLVSTLAGVRLGARPLLLAWLAAALLSGALPFPLASRALTRRDVAAG